MRLKEYIVDILFPVLSLHICTAIIYWSTVSSPSSGYRDRPWRLEEYIFGIPFPAYPSTLAASSYWSTMSFMPSAALRFSTRTSYMTFSLLRPISPSRP